MNAHLPVDAGALDADNDAKVGGEPGHVVRRAAVAAILVRSKVSKQALMAYKIKIYSI